MRRRQCQETGKKPWVATCCPTTRRRQRRLRAAWRHGVHHANGRENESSSWACKISEVGLAKKRKKKSLWKMEEALNTRKDGNWQARMLKKKWQDCSKEIIYIYGGERFSVPSHSSFVLSPWKKKGRTLPHLFVFRWPQVVDHWVRQNVKLNIKIKKSVRPSPTSVLSFSRTDPFSLFFF